MDSAFRLTTITSYFFPVCNSTVQFWFVVWSRFFSMNMLLHSDPVPGDFREEWVILWDIGHAVTQIKKIPLWTWIKYHWKHVRIHIMAYYKESVCCTSRRTIKGACFDLCFLRFSVLWGLWDWFLWVQDKDRKSVV